MNARQLVNNEDETLLPLNVDSILSVLKLKNKTLLDSETNELKNFFITDKYKLNAQIIKFINDLNQFEKAKTNAVGLTNEEKISLAKLNEDIEKNRPNRVEEIEETREKFDCIKEMLPIKIKYDNIIKCNKAYLRILNSPETWTQNLSDVENQWIKHKHFASCDSEQLLALYRLYAEAETSVLQVLISNCNYHKRSLSVNVYNALISYVEFVTEQIYSLQKQAIESMLLRLELMNNSIEIHDDDVIRYTVLSIEHVIQHRIIIEKDEKQNVFAELRKRIRKGLTYNVIAEYHKTISEFISHEAKKNKKNDSLKERLDKLAISQIPEELKNSFFYRSDVDLSFIILSNKFFSIKNVILESLLLEEDHALSLLHDLDNLLNTAHFAFQKLCSINKKYNNSNLEKILNKYQDLFCTLVNRVCIHLENELTIVCESLVKNIMLGKSFDLSLYQKMKLNYLNFIKKYNHLTNPCNALQYDLFFQLIYHLIDTIKRESSQNLSTFDKNNLIATAICQNFYWPINRATNNSYEASRKLMINLLGKIENYQRSHFYIEDEFIHYLCIFKYLEMAFLSQNNSSISSQLGLFYNKKYEEHFPLDYFEQQNNIISAPINIKNKIESLDKINKNILLNFLNSNQELIKRYRGLLNDIYNYDIHYLKNSPLIDIFNFNTLIGGKKVLNKLTEVNDEIDQNIENFLTTSKLDNKSIEILNLLRETLNKNTLAIISIWQATLLQRISFNTNIDEIQNYLTDTNNLIDMAKLKKLLDKINNEFDDHFHKSELILKIDESCTRILIAVSKNVLGTSNSTLTVNKYLENMTRLSFMKLNNNNTIENIVNNKEINKLIKNKIFQFDGSKSDVGCLLISLYSEKTKDSYELIKYISSYTEKRLQYIVEQKEAEISINDIIFFKRAKSITNIKETYHTYRKQYADIINNILNNNNVDPVDLRIVELFGDRDERFKYRLKCCDYFLSKYDCNQNDVKFLDDFINFELFHLEKNDIRSSEMVNNRERLIEYHSMHSEWSILRDKIITNTNPELAHLYHHRMIFEFLNNSHAVDLDDSLKNVLGDCDPVDFLGQENLDILIKHILMLLKTSYKSLDIMDLNNAQIDNELKLLSRIDKLKVIFEKVNDLVGYQTLFDTTSLKNSFELIKSYNYFVKRKEKFPIKNNNSIDVARDILNITINIFDNMELDNNMSLSNLKNIVIDLTKTMTTLLHMKLETNTNSSDVVEVLNLQTKITMHLKSYLTHLAMSSDLSDYDRGILREMKNYIDDNSVISTKKSLVIEMLNQDLELSEFINALLGFANVVNNLKSDFTDMFDELIYLMASKMKQGSQSLKLSCACILILFENKSPNYSRDFLDQWFEKLHENINKISLTEITFFSSWIAQNKEILVKIINHNSNNVVLISNSIFPQDKNLDKPTIFSRIEQTLKGKCLLVDALNNIYQYISRKTKKISNIFKKVPLENTSGFMENLVNNYYQYIKNNNDPKYTITFIKHRFNINEGHRARKIESLIQVSATIINVFKGSEGKNSILDHIDLILKKVNLMEKQGKDDYYLPNKFPILLKEIKDLVTGKITEKNNSLAYKI